MLRKSFGRGFQLNAVRNSRTLSRCTKPSAGLKFCWMSRTTTCATQTSFGYAAEKPYDQSRVETPSLTLRAA